MANLPDVRFATNNTNEHEYRAAVYSRQFAHSRANILALLCYNWNIEFLHLADVQSGIARATSLSKVRMNFFDA